MDDRGNIFVADVLYGRILKIDPEKRATVCVSWDGKPNGLAVAPVGHLLVADYKQV